MIRGVKEIKLDGVPVYLVVVGTPPHDHFACLDEVPSDLVLYLRHEWKQARYDEKAPGLFAAVFADPIGARILAERLCILNA